MAARAQGFMSVMALAGTVVAAPGGDAGRPSTAANSDLRIDAAVDRESLRFPGSEPLTVTVTLPLAFTKRTPGVRLGRTIRISGRTDPPLASGPITLLVSRTGVRRQSKLATVRTDRLGRFTHRWTPRTAGVYQLSATSPGGPNRSPDHSCALAIELTR